MAFVKVLIPDDHHAKNEGMIIAWRKVHLIALFVKKDGFP